MTRPQRCTRETNGKSVHRPKVARTKDHAPVKLSFDSPCRTIVRMRGAMVDSATECEVCEREGREMTKERRVRSEAILTAGRELSEITDSSYRTSLGSSPTEQTK